MAYALRARERVLFMAILLLQASLLNLEGSITLCQSTIDFSRAPGTRGPVGEPTGGVTTYQAV